MSQLRRPFPIPAVAATLLAMLALTRCGDPATTPVAMEAARAAGNAGPTVTSTNPAGAKQDTTLDVSVFGSGYDRGSTVAFGVAGTPSSEVVTNSTQFVSPKELRANITVSAVAQTGSYDVIVTTLDGRKGIGTEKFAITTSLATEVTLPSLKGGAPAEALAVNNAGTVIAGYAWEGQRGTMRAVKWVLQANGSWAITVLPHAATATGAIARSVNRAGDVSGNDWPGSTPHAVLWPAAGGVSVLGCDDLGRGNGISADGQVVVGTRSALPGRAAVWRPGSCAEDLPLLLGSGSSSADAANGDASILGGLSSPNGVGLPVRWRLVAGVWQVEQLDGRTGGVRAANTVGDLAGSVQTACAATEGCSRAVIWYAGGGSLELGTLGGATSWARGINEAGEVVGGSSTSGGQGTAYFWSGLHGMFELRAKGSWAAANAISDVRPDGTRMVAGMDALGHATAWVIRNP